jgi:hypothetical protein
MLERINRHCTTNGVMTFVVWNTCAAIIVAMATLTR